MLRAALIFFVLALVAMVFGSTGIAGMSMEIGRVLLTIFFVLAIVSLIGGLITGNRRPKTLP